MFHHYLYNPGRGRQSIGDKILMTTEKPCHFPHFLQVSNWSLQNLILYTFLMILYMYIAPGQEQKTPWGQTFDVNRKSLSLRPFVASFKQISLNDFIHVYSPGARAENPLGTNFWCQQKVLITSTICCKFQKNLFEFWFYTHVFPHVYSPGAGTDNPLWTKSWCQQKSLVTFPIRCKFQKFIFEVWFYTPGQGQTDFLF